MYKKITHSWLKHFDFICIDCVCLYVSFLLAYFLRRGICNPYEETIYRSMSIVFLLINICAFVLVDTLKNVLKRDNYIEIVYSVKHVLIVELLTIIYLFTIQESESYSRIILYLTGILYFIITYSARCIYKKIYLHKMQEGGKRSLLIITTDAISEKAVKAITDHNYELFRIAGIVITDRNRKGESIQGVPVVANIDDVLEYTRKEWVDEVFLDYPEEDSSFKILRQRFIEMGVVVHLKLWKSRGDETEISQFVEKLGPYTVLTTSIVSASPIELLIKRCMDIAGGFVGCLITGILCLIIGPMIYISSPGPIFFSQERVGKNGKKFRMYKFRSMYMDAEARKEELMQKNRMKDARMFKLDFDPRIIGAKQYEDGRIKKGIGNYIRDYSLDEFPQFFNILKGDMSLVGTRPPTVDEWEKYELHHRARLSIKPGLTGMWQVSGRSNIIDFEEVVGLDTKYIQEWNLLLDIRILVKTVSSVLKKEGSM